MSQAKKSANKYPTNKQRLQYLVLALAALLIGVYITLWRAVDTGSWWEYGYTFVLFVFALNRFLAATYGLGHKLLRKS